MKYMKKRTYLVAVLVLAMLCAGALSGCGGPKTYTVTFDLNGGELVSGELTQTVEEGQSAKLPKAVNGNMTLSWVGDWNNVTADSTVVAEWTKVEYTVTFDLNGGELVSGELVQTVEAGEDAVPPEAVNGRKELTWSGDWQNVTGNCTVTAEWNSAVMDTVDLAEYVQERTVTVNVETLNGYTSTGSGFFIDSEGTIVTNFHVIDLASSISVEISSGASYPVQSVVDFSNAMDLAVLKINVKDQPYLELSDSAARTGEQVYAVGSALGVLKGSFTGGIISSTSRTYGASDCLQMDVTISSGNSGGPLVNVYGEVVGINSASYVDGENTNLAIKVSMLEKLDMDKNWSVKEFKEWYETESSRSWSPWYVDSTGRQTWNYSLVNTYQQVTGAECKYSCYDYYNDAGEIDTLVDTGYVYDNDYFVYDYKSAEYDTYVAYLKEVGFEYDRSQEYSDGTSYYYYNSKDGIELDLFIKSDFSQIWIYPTLG